MLHHNEAGGYAHRSPVFFLAVNGRNAVVLFFVLSGFVLSESLSRSGVTVQSSMNFLVRRAFRILPLTYVMMAVSTAYLLFLLPKIDLSHFAHHGCSADTSRQHRRT